jgi:heme/copper-type cytochrome/quinol oxidase subunit 2
MSTKTLLIIVIVVAALLAAAAYTHRPRARASTGTFSVHGNR